MLIIIKAVSTLENMNKSVWPYGVCSKVRLSVTSTMSWSPLLWEAFWGHGSFGLGERERLGQVVCGST